MATSRNVATSSFFGARNLFKTKRSIDPEQHDVWCERLATRLTELISAQQHIIDALEGEGQPVVVERLVENFRNTSEEASYYRNLGQVPRGEREMLLTNTRFHRLALLQARGLLDSRTSGVREASSYDAFCIAFISQQHEDARQNLHTSMTLETIYRYDIWKDALRDLPRFIQGSNQ